MRWISKGYLQWIFCMDIWGYSMDFAWISFMDMNWISHRISQGYHHEYSFGYLWISKNICWITFVDMLWIFEAWSSSSLVSTRGNLPKQIWQPTVTKSVFLEFETFKTFYLRNSNAEVNSWRLSSADDSVPVILSWGSFQKLFWMKQSI
jgi:hypothetical protein